MPTSASCRSSAMHGRRFMHAQPRKSRGGLGFGRDFFTPARSLWTWELTSLPAQAGQEPGSSRHKDETKGRNLGQTPSLGRFRASFRASNFSDSCPTASRGSVGRHLDACKAQSDESDIEIAGRPRLAGPPERASSRTCQPTKPIFCHTPPCFCDRATRRPARTTPQAIYSK